MKFLKLIEFILYILLCFFYFFGLENLHPSQLYTLFRVQKFKIIKYQDSEASSSQSNDISQIVVQKFILPNLNVEAKAYHQVVNLDNIDFKQPPAIRHLDNATIEQSKHQSLILKHPCFNQRVERQVNVVTEASASAAGHVNRDDIIHQRIRLRKLMKIFETKMQFNV